MTGRGGGWHSDPTLTADRPRFTAPMFVRTVRHSPGEHGGKISVRVVRSVRRGSKVEQRVVAYLGTALPGEAAECLKEWGRHQIRVEAYYQQLPLFPEEEPESF